MLMSRHVVASAPIFRFTPLEQILSALTYSAIFALPKIYRLACFYCIV